MQRERKERRNLEEMESGKGIVRRENRNEKGEKGDKIDIGTEEKRRKKRTFHSVEMDFSKMPPPFSWSVYTEIPPIGPLVRPAAQN